MRALRRFWSRLIGTVAGWRRERELADEIEMHLQMQTEDNLKLGMSPQEARRAAVLRFGGVEALKESYRDQRGLPWLENIARDVRFALRMMGRNPGFTAAAVLSLALGIGVTTAIYSVAEAILLRPLPYQEPGRLAAISADGAVTAPMFETFRREARSIEGAALYVNQSFDLVGQGDPERVPGARVSAGLFELLGIAPRLGRGFTAGDDNRSDILIIGDTLWKRRFGGDPHVLGRTLILDGSPYTIIGVMPPGFQFPDGPELPSWAGVYPPAQMWRPMALKNWERTCRGCYNFAMIARLRPGVTSEQARAELDGILEHLMGGKSQSSSGGLTVRTLHEVVTKKARIPILMLFAGAALSLLIACVNLANLLLARGLRRQGEIGLRISLGASGRRVVGQLLTEALTLACCAAAAAVPVAWAGIRVLLAIAPEGIPRIEGLSVDARLLGFALAAALLSTLVFGVAPAFLTARCAPGEAIKASGGHRGTGRFPQLRSALVVVEFAFSIVLLVASSLLIRSFQTVAHTPLGFHTENVLTFRTSLPTHRHDRKRNALAVEELAARCGTLTGVIGCAAVNTLPLTEQGEGWGVIALDNPNQNDWADARVRAVTPSYFRTMGIRLLAGRDFTANDSDKPVAIVSQTAARRLWPGIAVPLGRRLRRDPPLTVVGIVDDTRASGLDVNVRPYLYIPFRQLAPREFALVARSTGDAASLAAAVKSEIWKVEKGQAVIRLAVMQQLVDDALAMRRFLATLTSIFGVFALLLAAIGVYGVLSYAVAQRTREIGIRLALGASRMNVLAGIMKQAGALAFAGASLGLIAAFELTPLLRSLLYGVEASEFSVFAGCAALLVVVALVASFVPARRAAKLDPMVSLRCE